MIRNVSHQGGQPSGWVAWKFQGGCCAAGVLQRQGRGIWVCGLQPTHVLLPLGLNYDVVCPSVGVGRGDLCMPVRPTVQPGLGRTVASPELG